MNRSHRVRLIGLAIAALVPVSSGLAAEVPYSPYLKYLYAYADAILAHGRDTYGPKKSGLILSALDRETLAPLTTRPASPAGIRRDDRNGHPWEELVGANPQRDQNLLRLLYKLTLMSQETKYRDAADAELKWFLENTRSPATGLLPWGEHLSWNVMTDQVIHNTHEYARPWVLWERCFELAPEASRKFALGLWEHQIGDHKTGAFDRHADYDKHGPGTGRDYPRHAGFYIRTWAEAHAKTKDPVFLTAIDTVLSRFERKRDPKTGLIPDRGESSIAAPLSSLSMAIDCWGAAGRLPEEMATRLRKFTTDEDAVFCALPHDLKTRRGFVETALRATGVASAPAGVLLDGPPGPFTPLWDGMYGAYTTASVGMMCVARYENGGGTAYRDLIVAAADCYLTCDPTEDVDVWPMTMGHVISLELAAWRITAQERYFKRAEQLGLLALDLFWEDKPLPKASLKTGHYETITGCDSLALALFDLHLTTLHITAVSIPCNTLDR
ncbi:MAG: hypothetical protein AMXMBFR13_07620 [Phycisphaerae bacterium]